MKSALTSETDHIIGRRRANLGPRPRVLAILPAFMPSTTLTVVKPLTNLHRAGHIVADITLEPWVSARQIDRADVIAFSRNTNAAVLDRAIASGKPIIYNIDDNLFEIPASYGGGLEIEHQQLKRYLRAANLVRAYSEPLKNYLLRFNPNVEVCETAIDWRLVPKSPPVRNGGAISIVYATSRWQKDSMPSIFLDDLRRLLETYRDRVRVVFWGYCPREFSGHARVRFRRFTVNYDKFFRGFANAEFEIGLAPLQDDDFHRSKCNNKFREYAASRIAGIYSDVSVYSTGVEDERSGLLVKNEPGEWLKAMTRLVEDESLRRNIQEEAFRIARARYTRENDDAVWLAHIRRMIGEASINSDHAAKGQTLVSNDRYPVNGSLRLSHFRPLAHEAISQCWFLVKMFVREGGRKAFQQLGLYAGNITQLARLRLALRKSSGAE